MRTADDQAENDMPVEATCLNCGEVKQICCGQMTEDWSELRGYCADCCNHSFNCTY